MKCATNGQKIEAAKLLVMRNKLVQPWLSSLRSEIHAYAQHNPAVKPYGFVGKSQSAP